MRKNEEDQGAKLVRHMLDVLLGGAVALLACFLFLLLASVGVSRGWLGEDLMYQLAIVGCVLGSFMGGTVAVGRCRSRTLVVGLLVGVVLFLLLLTIGVLFYDAVAPEAGGLGLLSGSLCGGAAAGILGGKPKKRRTRSR